MDPFEALIRRTEAAKKGVLLSIQEGFAQFDMEIVEIQTMEQLFQGEFADGSMIRPAYTPFTISIKKKKGQPTDRVTFKDTGKLYDSIKLNVFADRAEIVSNDSKVPKLLEKYKGPIFGIQPKKLAEFVEEKLRPLVVQNVLDEFTN